MKNFFIFFISICSAISLRARETVYPQLQSVINKLFSTYDVPETRAESNLHFAKKPEGWFVQWTDQTKVPERVISEELFWSVNKESFVKLATIPPGKTPIAAGLRNSLYQESEKYRFARIPYYGYIGWDRDVIKGFDKQAVLTDSLLEGLSGAYSNYASGFTDHNFGYHIANDGMNEKTKLDSFVFYWRLAIAMSDKLRKLNPGYEMLAGNAGTKYSGDVMAFYDHLQLSGNENLATGYFKEELFTPVILANAKVSLSQCAPGGIIFTNGDNDTYPLEYLQFAKGFRTDVTVINLSMLNLSSTILQASKGKGKALPVKFTYPLERYASENTDCFFMESSTPGDITYKQFISKSYLQKPEDGTSFPYYNYPQCTIEFPGNKVMFPEIKSVVRKDTPRIRIDKSYLLRSDFAQLDIIMSNLDSRPVYYAITGEAGLNLDKYLFGEGMVKRFVPFEMENGNTKLSMTGRNVLTEVSFTNLMNIEATAFPIQDKDTDGRMVANFRLQFLELAQALVTEEPRKAIQLLDRCDSLFPSAIWKYEPAWIYGITTYYKAGQFEKGDRVAMEMLAGFESMQGNIKSEEYKQELMLTFQATEILKLEAEKHNREAVVKGAAAYLQKRPIDE